MVQSLKKILKLIAVTTILCFFAMPSLAYQVFMFPHPTNTRAPLECPTVDIENNVMTLSSDNKNYYNTDVVIKDNKGNVIISENISCISASNKYDIDISYLKQGKTYEIDFFDGNIAFQGHFDIE